MDNPQLQRQLEELNLLQCSLMPGETLSFVSEPDDNSWPQLLAAYTDSDPGPSMQTTVEIQTPARFQIHVDNSAVSFEITIPLAYPSGGIDGAGELVHPQVLVRGDAISRGEQERWQAIVKNKVEEVRASEYLLYELISSHLLPLLHEEVSHRDITQHDESSGEPSGNVTTGASTRYHALLTSHHLISPTKRRNLQQWSSQLHITGFAKVGYPGVIYCEGIQDQVEEFVANVKAMQWLALRVRFVEPIPSAGDTAEPSPERWVEFEKVGEVVEEMRRLGREMYVVEMGIGSAGINDNKK